MLEKFGKATFVHTVIMACRDLQRWLLDNRAAFPELRGCDCDAIQANLRSAASCGLWLGGVRGKKLPGGGGCCK